MYLQTYVVPICRFETLNGQAYIKETLGTGFFINSSGVFITAKHVIDDCYAATGEKGGDIGLSIIDTYNNNQIKLIAPLKDIEFANPPYDIAIGKVDYISKTFLCFKEIDNINVEVWLDVATYGYPATTIVQKPMGFRINLRAQKGYIQRIISPEDETLSLQGNQPNSFELSFLIGHGLSGSPLFVHRNPKDIIIGVCVGTHRTEYKGCIEEYGVAQDIRPLLTWKPSFLNGKTLLDI